MQTKTKPRQAKENIQEALRLRPKSRYMEEASLERLYVLTDHWDSDMKFYSEDLTFLKNLISKYFVWLSKDNNISEVKKILNKVKRLKEQQEKISQEIKNHYGKMENLMEIAFNHEEEAFRKSHGLLEDKIADFVKSFRTVKKEVFSITEHMIEDEKLMLMQKQE